MIIVNSVCDTCTSFAIRLRFDLYTFLEIFWMSLIMEFVCTTVLSV